MEQLIELRRENEQLRLVCAQLQGQLKQRLDTSMIDAKTKLASSLGQMMDSAAHAIGYITGSL